MTERRADVDLHHHGDQEAAPGLVDFAVNVQRTGPPRWLRTALAAGFDSLGRYPDQSAAVGAVAARHGRGVEVVLLTAGAAEAFVLLARALQPRHAVSVHPSFTEPEAALRAAGHPVHRALLPPPYSLDPAIVAVDADLVVVGNPTNPTGVLHDPVTVLELARPDRVLVVDEAFIDTVPGESGSLAGRRDVPGLVVVRSLTKTWGLAGLRAGYVLGPADVLARLRTAQPLWPVSSPALTAITACCSPAALAEADAAARSLAGHRAHLVAELTARGLAVVAESHSSFVLVQAPDAATLWQRLREQGVAVRRGDTFPGLGPDHLRIAVRPPEQVALLLHALDRVLTGTYVG